MRFERWIAALQTVVILCLLVLISVGMGGLASAASSWTKPGSAQSLSADQTQAVVKLVAQLEKAAEWDEYFRCYFTGNGKCPRQAYPDLSQKDVAKQRLDDINQCLPAFAAARRAGVPDAQPIDFDKHHDPDLNLPVSFRNTEHLCVLYQGMAERHYNRLAKGLNPIHENDARLGSIADEVGITASRLTRWQAVEQCYQTKGDSCDEQPDVRKAEYIPGWKRDSDRCLAAVKEAHDLGLPANHPIDYVVNGVQGLQSPEPFEKMETYCKAQLSRAVAYLEKVAGAQPQAAEAASSSASAVSTAAAADKTPELPPEQEKVLGKLFQNSPQVVAAYQAYTDPKNNSSNEERRSLADFWAGNAKECQTLADEAFKVGVPKDYPFAYPAYDSGLKTPMPLAAYVKDVCVKTYDLAKAALDEKNAKNDAVVAPYVAVLKGDRLRLFQEHKLHTRLIQGPGGVELTTPEQFAKSEAWYTTVIDRNGVSPRWQIGGWQFNGDKVLRNYSDSGWGTTAPSNAFPTVSGGAPGSYEGSSSGGGFFGFIWWVIWTIIRVAVLAIILLVIYTWYGKKIPQVEMLLDKVPMARQLLAKLPIPVRRS